MATGCPWTSVTRRSRPSTGAWAPTRHGPPQRSPKHHRSSERVDRAVQAAARPSGTLTTPSTRPAAALISRGQLPGRTRAGVLARSHQDHPHLRRTIHRPFRKSTAGPRVTPSTTSEATRAPASGELRDPRGGMSCRVCPTSAPRSAERRARSGRQLRRRSARRNDRR